MYCLDIFQFQQKEKRELSIHFYIHKKNKITNVKNACIGCCIFYCNNDLKWFVTSQSNFASTSVNKSCNSCTSIFLTNIHIVHDTYCTSKASSAAIPRQKPVQKYQHKERYNLRKYHIYQKMIRKCKFQMAHNPWNINHFEKEMFWERDSNPINQNINTIPQKAKNWKSRIHMQRIIDPPQRTSTMKDLLPGNYLILFVYLPTETTPFAFETSCFTWRFSSVQCMCTWRIMSLWPIFSICNRFLFIFVSGH